MAPLFGLADMFTPGLQPALKLTRIMLYVFLTIVTVTCFVLLACVLVGSHRYGAKFIRQTYIKPNATVCAVAAVYCLVVSGFVITWLYNFIMGHFVD
jgi:hypothetical protein